MYFQLVNNPRFAIENPEAAARRQELVGFGLTGVLYAGAIACGIVPVGQRIECDVNFAGHADIRRCYYTAVNFVPWSMTVVAFFETPRLVFAVPIYATYITVHILGQYIEDQFDWTDCVVAGLGAVVYMAMLLLQTVVRERAERRHFINNVKLQRANRDIAKSMCAVKEVLRAAMPQELFDDDLSLSLSAASQRSADATVGICAFADFAQWSCGMLEHEVVLVLHNVSSQFDLGLAMHGVVRAMTYGDRYVVCAGLISECDRHDEHVLAFAEWQLVAGPATTSALPFQVRAAVCTGPLVGGVAGSTSMRYVLSGPAFAQAQQDLIVAAPQTVRTAVLTVNPNFVDAGQGTPPLESFFKIPVDLTPTITSVPFSRITLRFDDENVQAEADLFFEAEAKAMADATCIIPSLFFVMMLTAAQIEMSSERLVRPSHANPLPSVLLATAAVISYSSYAIRNIMSYRNVYALQALGLVVGMLGLATIDCVFAAPHLSVICVLGFPAMFPRLQWHQQTLLQFLCVVAPASYWASFVYPFAKPFTAVINLNGFLLFVVVRYSMSKWSVVRFIVSRVATSAVNSAVERAQLHQALLSGLLPPHVLPHADPMAFSQGQAPAYMRQWQNLSTLQVSMQLDSSATTFAHFSAAWSGVASTVADIGGGLLEMMQATGDTFLVAGPFTEEDDKLTNGAPRAAASIQRINDERRHAAALYTVALVRALHDLLAQSSCSFTAVMTCGNAYGALLGASLLTFRLFGSAVRESDAMLEAAPRWYCPIAFATDGFRRQHANFGFRKSRAPEDAGMSVAYKSRFGASTSQVSWAGSDDEAFCEAVTWRVRGVGAMAVCALRHVFLETLDISPPHDDDDSPE
jgi:hypothetical protein